VAEFGSFTADTGEVYKMQRGIGMICPKCGVEMENGYLQSMRRAAWVKTPHKVSLLPKQGEILLENNATKDVVFNADICKSCKIILVDYSNKDIQESRK